MKLETPKMLQLAEKRVLALRCLADEMLKAQDPLTRLDAAAIRENTGQQQRRIDEIRHLDRELKRLRQCGRPELDPVSSSCLRTLARELQEVQAEVRRLNYIQARLLQAWRCSINVLTSFTGSYQPPAALRSREWAPQAGNWGREAWG